MARRLQIDAKDRIYWLLPTCKTCMALLAISSEFQTVFNPINDCIYVYVIWWFYSITFVAETMYYNLAVLCLPQGPSFVVLPWTYCE